jgi:HSP20 family protein
MANVSRYDPFGELFDDLFKGFFVKPVGYEGAPATTPVRSMRVEVSEHNGEYKVQAELPGVKKEDIRVQIEGDQVSIAAEVKAEREAKEGERVVHSERYYGKVARSFRLGEDIDDSKAEAKYADGVLELRLPKKAVTASRQISIQ